MNPIRLAFIILTVAVVAGAGYAGFYGQGGESVDLDKSVRTGSGGYIGVGGRVK